MHADAKMDIRVKTLLSGLEKIVSSIGEMRNNSSDSHGVGQRRIAVEGHHAMLAVNSAATMAEFILAVVENAKA
ncbi:MAG: abortive infection family protein [Eggerthellaceae bacterium]|nr:abortive infection family protein [Eggerthellaceae bacterium]